MEKSKSEITDHVLGLVRKMTYTDSYITRQCEISTEQILKIRGRVR